MALFIKGGAGVEFWELVGRTPETLATLSWSRFLLANLLPVTLGCLWLLGACGGLGIPIGLLSVTAAPLVLGIGFDDGLHALHGEKHRRSLVDSVRHVGPAMVMTSATTCVGFGSLMLSRVPALRNGGAVVCMGVALSLVASLCLLPALQGSSADRGPSS